MLSWGHWFLGLFYKESDLTEQCIQDIFGESMKWDRSIPDGGSMAFFSPCCLVPDNFFFLLYGILILINENIIRGWYEFVNIKGIPLAINFKDFYFNEQSYRIYDIKTWRLSAYKGLSDELVDGTTEKQSFEFWQLQERETWCWCILEACSSSSWLATCRILKALFSHCLHNSARSIMLLCCWEVKQSKIEIALHVSRSCILALYWHESNTRENGKVMLNLESGGGVEVAQEQGLVKCEDPAMWTFPTFVSKSFWLKEHTSPLGPNNKRYHSDP